MSLRFSIIVPTLNRADMLRTALASVRAQGYADVEIIVVDGGSSDSTLDDISAQTDIHLLHGPDRGLWDAINKGVAVATGDVIGLLNSDDTYEAGAFHAVAAAFAENPDADAVCGAAVVTNDDRIVAVFDRPADQSLTAHTALIGSCIPNARFFRRPAMARIGAFSLDYRFVADRDWLTRWYEAGMTTVAISPTVYRYAQHAGSLTFDVDRRREAEIRAELMRLAQSWRKAPAASRSTRRTAMALEGRLRAKLAVGAIRAGRGGVALRALFMDDKHFSLMPPATLIHGGVDWLARKLRPAATNAPES